MKTLFPMYAGNCIYTTAHKKVKVKWEHYLIMLPYYYIKNEPNLNRFEYLNRLLEQGIDGDRLENLLELYGE